MGTPKWPWLRIIKMTGISCLIAVAPAHAAGLEPGDTVTSFDGQPVHTWDELSAAIRARADQPTAIEWTRDGQAMSGTLTPRLTERPVTDALGRPERAPDGTAKTEQVGFIGMGSQIENVRGTPLDAVEQVERQQMMMMPPTWLTCLDIGQHADPDAVLTQAQSRNVEIYTPEVVPDGDDFVLSTPPHYSALMAAR